MKKEGILSVKNKVEPITNISEIMSSAVKSSVVTETLPSQGIAVHSSGYLSTDEKKFPILPKAAEENDQIGELKQQLSVALEKVEVQGRQFGEIIDGLKEERNALRAQVDAFWQENTHSKEEELLSHLKAENAAYKAQMDAQRTDAEVLVRELEVAKGDHQNQIDRLNAEIGLLKTENDRLRSIHVIPPEGLVRDQGLNVDAIESLTEDVDVLRQDKARLEASIEDFQAGLLEEKERNSFLQYELTKSRAQSAGMERICSNARSQFEGFAREARDTEMDNVLLKKQANALEQGLVDFKRLNTELLKRERLTQYEMDNNRTQLKDLEHIYQVFRARLDVAGVNLDSPVK
ncbi:MAG: hypothetical protein HQL22_08595 [Candidatus Omnitrophica bacterium]|nr:hypothetical protein [Candidatus Omnitrophota bacterium]